MRVFIISPHPDDVVLSMGGAVGRLADAEVVIVTCFSESCVHERADRSETTTARSLDDAAYARAIDAGIIRLGLPDSNLRGNVGREPLVPDEERALRRRLQERLASVVSQDALVFAPLAVGRHPDHLHCREAARGAFHRLVLYEDLPYAQMQGGTAGVERLVRQDTPALQGLLVRLAAFEMEGKRRGLGHYSSQIHPSWRADVDTYARAIGGGNADAERFWVAPELVDQLPDGLLGNALPDEPSAPIVFIHYGDSYYLRHTLQAALEFNPDKQVVLLGDSNNRHYERLGIHYQPFADYDRGDLIARFDAVYQYIAGEEQQREAWTNFVFRRWYLLYNFTLEHGILAFWTFDSDTLIVSALWPATRRSSLATTAPSSARESA